MAKYNWRRYRKAKIQDPRPEILRNGIKIKTDGIYQIDVEHYPHGVWDIMLNQNPMARMVGGGRQAAVIQASKDDIIWVRSENLSAARMLFTYPSGEESYVHTITMGGSVHRMPYHYSPVMRYDRADILSSREME